MDWVIDGKQNLTKTAEKAGWHHGTTVAALVAEGIERRDAEAFTCFVFSDSAEVADCAPEEYLDDGLWGRLSLARS